MVIFALFSNLALDSIVRLGRRQNRPDKLEHVDDLVGRLPGVGAQDAQAHAAVFVVGDVWVVDFGAEADEGWLEGVFFGEGDVEFEMAVLLVRG